MMQTFSKTVTKIKSKIKNHKLSYFSVLALMVVFFQNCNQKGFQAQFDTTRYLLDNNSSSSTNNTNSTNDGLINLKLAWDKSTSSEVKGYKLLIGSKSGQYDSTIDVGLTDTPDTPTYELSTLKANTEYFITAIAYSDTMESTVSNELHIASTK